MQNIVSAFGTLHYEFRRYDVVVDKAIFMQEKSANFKQCKVWKLHFKWESWSNLP